MIPFEIFSMFFEIFLVTTRAVELGLTTEDLVTVEDLVSQEEPVIKPISVKEVHADATQSFVSILTSFTFNRLHLYASPVF